jgi:hypothetical protein
MYFNFHFFFYIIFIYLLSFSSLTFLCLLTFSCVCLFPLYFLPLSLISFIYNIFIYAGLVAIFNTVVPLYVLFYHYEARLSRARFI